MEVLQLVRMARQGDQEALVKLIMNNKDDYYRLAYAYLQNRQDSLDALQDMIVVLYDHIGKLRKPESFDSWSKKILVNCCRKILKANKKAGSPEREAGSGTNADYPHQGAAEDFSGSEQRQDLLRGLRQLNSFQREAIVLKYFLDWDYARIAEATGTPLGTVKSRISIGLSRLREIMGVEKDHDGP